MRRLMWLAPARKAFDGFPEKVRRHIAYGLDRAMDGGKADNAKPLHGIDGGAFEITARDHSGAYRAIYALKVGIDIWVVHAFQKKSHRECKSPKKEIDLIRDRIRKLRRVQ